MQLLILRHAETWANVEGRMQGNRDLVLASGQNSELTPRGQRQAIALGKRLEQYLPPTQIHLSPLRRVRETWKQFSCKPLRPICYEPALQEVDQGVFSGLTWLEAEQQYPSLCQALLNHDHWIAIPQGEAPHTVRGRAETVVKSIFQTSADSDRVWIMTHGGFIPYLVAALLGSDRTWGFSVELAALFEFSISQSEAKFERENQHNSALQQIKYFNDTIHLQELKN